MNKRIFDITPRISPDLGVWPGDTPCSRKVQLDIARGDNITLSTLTATVHLGAHADAPSHYGGDAPPIEQVKLERYIGPCQVVIVTPPRGSRITPDMLRRSGRAPRRSRQGRPTARTKRFLAPRVLFSTGTFPDPHTWNNDFAALSTEMIDLLHDSGVELVGIDTPSVDLIDSKDLPAHHRILEYGMSILEGLCLADVPAGPYELIALPLPLVGFDASPVRAILRTLPRRGSG